MPTKQAHWDTVYQARNEDALTWFEPTSEFSLKLINEYDDLTGGFVDIGGGASRLVDSMLQANRSDISVLDISPQAIAMTKDRLGEAQSEVEWIISDITKWQPQRHFNLWHDRAVFHFLTNEDDRCKYLNIMAGALNKGAVAIIATFALDGPEKCSGLPTVRYSAQTLHDQIEKCCPKCFGLAAAHRHLHITPMGNEQSFQYAVFRRL